MESIQTQESSRLEAALLHNKKRTYQMFLGQLDEKLPDVEEIARAKLAHKVTAWYSGLGKIPGVLIEDAKRRKLLRDLGVSQDHPKA